MLTELYLWVYNKNTKAYECMCKLVSKSSDFDIYRCEKDLFLLLNFNSDMYFMSEKYKVQKLFFEIS